MEMEAVGSFTRLATLLARRDLSGAAQLAASAAVACQGSLCGAVGIIVGAVLRLRLGLGVLIHVLERRGSTRARPIVGGP